MEPQREFPFGSARARSEDPVTSHAAADSLRPQVITEIQRKVIAYAQAQGERGFTDEQLSTYFAHTRSTYRTRRAELTDLELIVDTGRRQVGSTGRRMIVWCHRDFATPQALKAAAQRRSQDAMSEQASMVKLVGGEGGALPHDPPPGQP